MASQSHVFSVKEFEFNIRFTAGADPVMDLFHEYPTLRLRNATCTVTENAMWRIDHVDGPADAISTFDEVFLDDDGCNECLDEHRCSGTREYQVLDRRPTARTVYTYHADTDRCRAVPTIVTDHIGDGVVFESERTGSTYRWRVLSPVETSLDPLFDHLESTLRTGVQLDVDHLGGAEPWRDKTQPVFPQ
ncbi:hypothetical protein HISP_19560 (plasmid) [Haloarcula hispanica N601]|uniref:HVO-2928 N-terminal domain-containing protein n=3 Tax=Haloarcula hispanica TaxID=51589 RepID=V5TSM1_HALHI|nr:hypothetical protein [Haloarcula hispanica]AEM59410.1 conserved hypothetical protein [Haloarcula hispanica ATCC 33960]AHB68256.1 hypothetical protein HISP_19560 [Haloarcula hispanica N601]MCJ0621319.1 hypothetical protein [Haloarcula hispanica]RYJ07928.1 hypothetical protein ELS20_17850 [Haloarcula hispanica]